MYNKVKFTVRKNSRILITIIIFILQIKLNMKNKWKMRRNSSCYTCDRLDKRSSCPASSSRWILLRENKPSVPRWLGLYPLSRVRAYASLLPPEKWHKRERHIYGDELDWARGHSLLSFTRPRLRALFFFFSFFSSVPLRRPFHTCDALSRVVGNLRGIFFSSVVRQVDMEYFGISK